MASAIASLSTATLDPAALRTQAGSDATGAAAGADSRKAKARAQSQDFEAMFLNSMFQQMFTGIDGEGPFGGAPGQGVWRSFLTDEYSKSFAKAGGVGLASHVYDSLLAAQEAHSKS